MDQAVELAAFLKEELGVGSKEEAREKGVWVLSSCVTSFSFTFSVFFDEKEETDNE